jgi:hypothetical protein
VIEGDPAPLLKRFANEVVEWNTALDAATSQAHLPALRTVSNASAAGAAPAAPLMPSAPLAPSGPAMPSAPIAPSAPAGSPRP